MATLDERAGVQPALRKLVMDAVANVPTGAAATAGDNATAINTLLARLRAAGLMRE